ncbi:MAG: hypothetical protein HOK17_12885 [Flammeovirgaceae bacterium]|nr:hypothetical protein [Flammeovirgaceae bacterium]
MAQSKIELIISTAQEASLNHSSFFKTIRFSTNETGLTYAREATFHDAKIEKSLYKDKDNRGSKLSVLLKRVELDQSECMAAIPELHKLPRSIQRRMCIELKYEGYIAREMRNIKSADQLEKVKVPTGFDFKKRIGWTSDQKR